MCGFICGVSTIVVGAILIVVSSLVGYGFVPGIIDNIIINEVVLINDTIQMERFEEVPFPLNFTIRLWNISNAAEVLSGAVPVMTEVGPYVYKLHQKRLVENIQEDKLTYRILDKFEFDAESSYPNTEDDMVTIVNIPYHAILQVAETMFPELMPALSLGLNGVFGQYNRPIVDLRVRDLVFDGIPLCQNPGLIGMIACAPIRELSSSAQNIVEQEDGSLLFSLLSYRNSSPSSEYVVHRGLDDPANLAQITSFAGLPHLLYWMDDDEGEGVCNALNGTDSGIFAPFVNRDASIYALNTDICRSVELRYQNDLQYEGIPVARFSANEWFMDNDEGCFCLNVTRGINREDGCLLRGALELYTCVGAFLVLSYPHFLYADFRYRNGVLGMNPVEDEHRIFVDLEPNTGTVVRGMKRAQFNIFMRPVTSISATQNLRTTLTPIAWFEEGMSLPHEFVDELTSKLLVPLNLVRILVPVLIALCVVVFLVGIIVTVWAKLRKPAVPAPEPTSTPIPRDVPQTAHPKQLVN